MRADGRADGKFINAIGNNSLCSGKNEVFYFEFRRMQSQLDSALSCSGAELGDGLGALSDGVLGELTGEEKADGGLDLAGGESVLLVVADETGGLAGDLLEDIVDEGVHDAHGSLADASLWVHLLEDTVDVDREGLGSLLLGGSPLYGSLATGSGSFSRCFLGHFDY